MKNDVIISLVSGRMRNKYSPITEILDKNVKTTKEQVMVGEGLRNRALMVDRKCHRKNKEEVSLLKEMRSTWKKNNPNHKHVVAVPFNTIK
jgi:hypothetical protein